MVSGECERPQASRYRGNIADAHLLYSEERHSRSLSRRRIQQSLSHSPRCPNASSARGEDNDAHSYWGMRPLPSCRIESIDTTRCISVARIRRVQATSPDPRRHSRQKPNHHCKVRSLYRSLCGCLPSGQFIKTCASRLY